MMSLFGVENFITVSLSAIAGCPEVVNSSIPMYPYLGPSTGKHLL